ncbi:MAG: hypothetical protein AAF432_17095, partial [Planctomycetota bacterium]
MHLSRTMGRRSSRAVRALVMATTCTAATAFAGVVPVDDGAGRTEIDSNAPDGTTTSAVATAVPELDGILSATNVFIDGPNGTITSMGNQTRRYVETIDVNGTSIYVLAYAMADAAVVDDGIGEASACASFDGLVEASVSVAAAFLPTIDDSPDSSALGINIDGSPDTPLVLPPPADGESYVAATSALSVAQTLMTPTAKAHANALAQVIISDAPITVGGCDFPDSFLCANGFVESVCIDFGGTYIGDNMACPG